MKESPGNSIKTRICTKDLRSTTRKQLQTNIHDDDDDDDDFWTKKANAIKDRTPSNTSKCLVCGTSRLLKNRTTASYDFVRLFNAFNKKEPHQDMIR